MPRRLREVSGLALTGDGRLLAVTDETAIVYEIEIDEMRLVKAFALGEPTVRGDFEGIAVLDETVYLLTSNGVIYMSPEGGDGERVAFSRHDTGLGDYCEFEGLAVHGDALLLLCKEMRSAAHDLRLYTWWPDAALRDSPRETSLPEREILAVLGEDRLRPSGITVDRTNGNRLIVAARQAALIELDQEGGLVDAIILPEKNKHRQAEGIELTADRRLLIADEGGDGRARLAIYKPRPTVP